MKEPKFVAILVLVLVLPVMLISCNIGTSGSASPNANGNKAEGNWLLKVDQTIPVKEGDVTVNYTLVLIAWKEGGKNVHGTYEGAAYIGSHLDISPLSKLLVQLSGGFDIDIFANNLNFKIEPFDKIKYSVYGSKDKASLAPLVKYESMALLTPEMKGGVIINPSVKSKNGLQGSYKKSGKGEGPVPMKIGIKSGKVHVSIPSIVGETFEGTITCDPQINEEEYQQALKRIEELAEREDKETTEQESDNSETQQSLTELNQIPWPDELVPGLPMACDLVNEVQDWRDEDEKTVINVYMSRDEAEAYFSKLKDLEISQQDTYSGNESILLEGKGEGFDLLCLYYIEDQCLSIQYYYWN